MSSVPYIDGQGNVRQRDITSTSQGTTNNPDVFIFSSNELGAKEDTVATSDTGSFSLIALFKRLLSSLTSNIGLQSDTVATSNTGSFSLISLFKRFLTLFARPTILYSNGTAAISAGTDVVAAPGAGNTVYITHLIFQNTNATTTTINVRSGTTTVLSIALTQNSVYSMAFPERRELALTANSAFNLQATNASAIVYSVGYYTGAV